MDRSGKRLNSFDCEPSTSTSIKTGASAGGDGDEQGGDPDPDVAIYNMVPAVERVFSIDLLLENVIMYAIHDSRGKISPKMVGVVRAVQKSWLESTTKILQKIKKPVITLDQSNLPSETKSQTKKRIKPLENFTAEFSAPTRLQRSFLPYKLVMDKESFRKENFKSVMACLKRTGEELVELKVNYPIDEVVGIPPLKFPFLQKLSFNFKKGKEENQRMMLDENFNHNLVSSLRYILRGSERLVHLIIGKDIQIEIPELPERLDLPDTLLSLEIGLQLENKQLEELVLQPTKLEKLKIFSSFETPVEDGLLLKFLERFRETLKSLHASRGFFWKRGHWHFSQPFLQLPLMENLGKLSLVGCELDLGAWSVSGIERCLPKLNELALFLQTEAMLAKWLDNLRSDSVKRIRIEVVNELLENEYLLVSTKMEMLAQVKSGFQNLTDFGLTLNLANMDILGYVFENMKQLTVFRLYLKGKIENDGSSRVDSIMTGIPWECLRPTGLCGIVRVRTGGLDGGIAKLSELKKLELCSKNWRLDEPEDQRISLISDLFFGEVLLKMT